MSQTICITDGNEEPIFSVPYDVTTSRTITGDYGAPARSSFDQNPGRPLRIRRQANDMRLRKDFGHVTLVSPPFKQPGIDPLMNLCLRDRPRTLRVKLPNKHKSCFYAAR